MPIATPTTSAARIVKEASRPPPGKTHLLFSEALALAYKPPPGDSRDYATRKASNEDCRRVDRFPTDRFEHVPTVTVPDPAKDFQRNDWLYWNQELEELERGLERSEEVKKFCTSPQAYVWSDAADLTQVLMDTLFKWLQSFFDTHKLRSADCPLWAKYPLRLTTQPPNGAPRHDSMVYLTGEQCEFRTNRNTYASHLWRMLTFYLTTVRSDFPTLPSRKISSLRRCCHSALDQLDSTR